MLLKQVVYKNSNLNKMSEQDLINIIDLLEYPDTHISLKNLGILSYLKIEEGKVTAIFALPDLKMDNRKDIANSVRIMAESFGYKFEYDFRKMSDEELENFNHVLKTI